MQNAEDKRGEVVGDTSRAASDFGPARAASRRGGGHASAGWESATSLLLGTLFTEAIKSSSRTPLPRTCTVQLHYCSRLSVASILLTLSRHLRLINCPFQARIEQATATMSDTALDPTISDDEVNDLATPGENEEVEAPRDTVEENGLDDDEDDLFGDGDDADEPA